MLIGKIGIIGGGYIGGVLTQEIAQRRLARDRRFASPFYWAGFTLQGDWR